VQFEPNLQNETDEVIFPVKRRKKIIDIKDLLRLSIQLFSDERPVSSVSSASAPFLFHC
jgi:hypothetical protein